MSYRRDFEQQVKDDAAERFADHVIETLREDGLYRHYRCHKPGMGRINSFDVITWPGYLCYCGDLGEFLFSRTADMIEFMRSAAMSYSYAAEKCVANRDSIREFREEVFLEVLDEELRDHIDQRRGDDESDEDIEADPMFLDKLADIRQQYGRYNDPSDAIRAMWESGLWDELPSTSGFGFRFLLCLHALKWFCDRQQCQTSAA